MSDARCKALALVMLLEMTRCSNRKGWACLDFRWWLDFVGICHSFLEKKTKPGFSTLLGSRPISCPGIWHFIVCFVLTSKGKTGEIYLPRNSNF